MKQPPKDDAYVGKLPGGPEGLDVMRSHRADAIVLENPVMDDMAKFLHDTWLAKKAALEKSRAKEPDVVILPPKNPPMPTKPTPVELPPKEEPVKKNPNPNLVRFGTWFAIISSVAGVVAWFFPPLKLWLLAIVPIVETILKVLGV
jgi:hypothetical protein